MEDQVIVDSSFVSGYVGIFGLPNAGKSTLLNHLIEQDLAIVSDKPQTTRNRILGIRTTETSQMLFLDTPGWYEGSIKLDKFFRGEVMKSLQDADIALFLVDGSKPQRTKNLAFYRKLITGKVPVIMLLTKLDSLSQTDIIKVLSYVEEDYPDCVEYIPVSAVSTQNVDVLIREIEKRLPQGPCWFPEDAITDRSTPFLLSEFVREGLFWLNQQEVPFSLACVVEDFKEADNLIEARVSIYVERDGQKLILLGAGGSKMNLLKGLASKRARTFFGKKIKLDLWIKVKPGWRQNQGILNQIGYKG